MLCRQCNGAVGANDGVCKTCGHPVRRGSNSKGLPRFAKFALIFLVLGACASFVVLYATGRIEFEFFGQSAPASSDEGLNLESDSTEYPPDTTTESSDTYAPTARRDEEAWHAMLANLHTVSSNYITSSAFHPFLTRGGFLYHLTEEAFITPEFFVSRNVLGEEYLAELKMIFYLRPVDFAGFDEIDLPPSNQMTVFVGYETVSGIGLYSIYGHHEIFRENLNKILLSYTPASGPSGRASSGQHIFDITVPNLGENINVRYFAYDENFVFVTISPVEDSSILRHHIFSRNEGVLTQVLSGIEATRHPLQVINHAIPNFNFDLLPDFDLASNNLVPISGFIFNSAIDPENPPVFAAKSSGFALVVWEGNRWEVHRYAAGDAVVVYETNRWQAAEDWLRENHVPLYILLQE